MNFIENYTETLKADLRHGIDNSVGKTNLRFDVFLAKSHGEIAKDLTDPRQWYNSDARHELISLLKGELPEETHDTVGSNTPSGYKSPVKTNNPTIKRTRFNGSRRYRQKQKREKRPKAEKYANPCPTPEQDLIEEQQNEEHDGFHSSMEVTATTPHDIRVMSSASAAAPPYLDCPVSAGRIRIIERTADNGNVTVNSVKMREFLDGIVSRKHLNKADMELCEGFVLPSISAVRADFLPQSLRCRHAKDPFGLCEPKKDLPIIDTTRTDAMVLDEQNKSSPERHIKISSKSIAKKDRFTKFVIDEKSDFVAKAKAELSNNDNSQYIDNWITTLKTKPQNPQPGSLQSPRKAKHKDKKRAVRSKTPGENQNHGMEPTMDNTGSLQLKQAIRIPSAQIVCAPQNDIQCDKVGHAKALKSALPRKHYAKPSVNLFKRNLATTQLKLHVIEHEIDDLFNKSENLRKAVARYPGYSPRQNEEETSKKEDNTQEMPMAKSPDELTSPVIKIPMENSDDENEEHGTALSTSQPRAPSVVSIEFAGGQTPRHPKGFAIRPTSSCVRVSSGKTPGMGPPPPQEVHGRKYPTHGKLQSSAHVTSLQVFAERKGQPSPLGRPYLSYEKHALKDQPTTPHNSRDNTAKGDSWYDKYMREARNNSKPNSRDAHNTRELTASQACLEFGIHPVSPNHRDCSTSQDWASCYSNLSERGYYGDLDSECSDPDRMMNAPDFLNETIN